MEVLEINGKKYVKANRAAKEAGYATDYVGQLCRSGAIDAQLVGRSWYVDADELRAHRTEKKRSSRINARKQVKAAIAASKNENVTATSKKVSIAYNADEEHLFPHVRKITPEAPGVQENEAVPEEVILSKVEEVKEEEEVEETEEDTVSIPIHIKTEDSEVVTDLQVESGPVQPTKSYTPFIPARVPTPPQYVIENQITTSENQYHATQGAGFIVPALKNLAYSIMYALSILFLITSVFLSSYTVSTEDTLAFTYTWETQSVLNFFSSIKNS